MALPVPTNYREALETLKAIHFTYMATGNFLQNTITEPNGGAVRTWRYLGELEKHIDYITEKATEELNPRTYFADVII